MAVLLAFTQIAFGQATLVKPYVVKPYVAKPYVAKPYVGESYLDKPYLQDYAVKYPLPEAGGELHQVRSDRNGVVQVLSSSGLLRTAEKALVPDSFYRPLADMNIMALHTYRQQLVYLTDTAVFSNAWAGKFYVPHNTPDASHIAMGRNFSFLLAGADGVSYFSDGRLVLQKKLSDFTPLQISYNDVDDQFLLLANNKIITFTVAESRFEIAYRGDGMTAMVRYGDRLVVGTDNGFLSLDAKTFKPREPLNRQLPWPEITSLTVANDKLWFGSSRGVFTRKEGGGFAYYASKRWLLDDHVIDIQPGPGGSILVLGKTGLSQIRYRKMTLADKAAYFDKIQRQRHIRYGLSSNLLLRRSGDLSSGVLSDTDNDGLWTSMYLASELLRYAVTQSDEALRNAYETFEAMEHLDFINPIAGFPSRTYERAGYASSGTKRDKDGELIWRLTDDEGWRWKSTTSSDESCGHFFVYALFTEIVPDRDWKDRAVAQIIRQMDHIIDNDWYLVSWHGKPTRWGRWNPEYVNSFPTQVGDRRLNSTLILAFLQTAYHFSGDSRYRDKATELIEQHGYLDNVLRPASAIGFVEGELLSDVWNHSDDEMYFLTAPALYKYAFNEGMQRAYAKTIKSHWLVERNEKSALWNFLYAMSGGREIDLDASIWWLQEFPLDLIDWAVNNSHRKDLTFLEPNFRKQTTANILPPDERPLHKHNNPAYRIDDDGGGNRERSPYLYLLPYWMGRYVGAIGPPQNEADSPLQNLAQPR